MYFCILIWTFLFFAIEWYLWSMSGSSVGVNIRYAFLSFNNHAVDEGLLGWLIIRLIEPFRWPSHSRANKSDNEFSRNWRKNVSLLDAPPLHPLTLYRASPRSLSLITPWHSNNYALMRQECVSKVLSDKVIVNILKMTQPEALLGWWTWIRERIPRIILNGILLVKRS